MPLDGKNDETRHMRWQANKSRATKNISLFAFILNWPQMEE